MTPEENDDDDLHPLYYVGGGCLFAIVFAAAVAGVVALFLFLVRWAWLAAG